MFKHMRSSWTGSNRGKVILGVWAVTVAGVTVKAVFTRRARAASERAAAAAEAAALAESVAAGSADPAAAGSDGVGKGPAAKKARKTKLRKLIKKAMKGKHHTVPWLAVLSVGICAKVLVSVQVRTRRGCCAWCAGGPG